MRSALHHGRGHQQVGSLDMVENRRHTRRLQLAFRLLPVSPNPDYRPGPRLARRASFPIAGICSAIRGVTCPVPWFRGRASAFTTSLVSVACRSPPERRDRHKRARIQHVGRSFLSRSGPLRKQREAVATRLPLASFHSSRVWSIHVLAHDAHRAVRLRDAPLTIHDVEKMGCPPTIGDTRSPRVRAADRCEILAVDPNPRSGLKEQREAGHS